ncbi:delta-60 repeat domain-containing protein [Dactylosporangium sp. CA-139066]|uniref:delta-60 repeat domain-containing protein n=1 Tax=Dactylosporangium sp. CA-139066 TaxID=3239930 RepID=UPI003D920C4A
MRRLLAAAAVLVMIAVAWPARAGTVLGLVSARPVAWTPNVLDGAVAAIAVVGDTVVVGGDFTTVADAATGQRYRRPNLFAFQLGTGRVLDPAPAVDGPVTALAAGPGGGVFVAGRFAHVNGRARTGLAELDAVTGQTVDGFTATAGKGQIRALAAAGPWLYAGGSFTTIGGQPRAGLARLDAATGAVDPGFDLRLARADRGTVKVEAIAVTADATRLAAVGAFDAAAGQRRAQLVVAGLGGPAPGVAAWSTDAYAAKCKTLYDSYLRGVDFAPDGTWLAVAATGGMSGAQRMCDSVARFDLAGGGNHRPAWVNRTGGNTLWSVAVTPAAVYVGGHQQWMDNPNGHKSAGPGAVARPGIAALDPATGAALPWNPTHSRGIGVGVLVTCPAGLLVGSDTDRLGREYHGRIGLLPA